MVYTKGAIPPVAIAVMVPSVSPLQEISVFTTLVKRISSGSITSMELLTTGPHPLTSVTETV